MFDEDTGRTAPSGRHKAGGVDPVAGFWDAQDILANATCGSGQPLSGTGWEGNYDAIARPRAPGDDVDRYCKTAGAPSACYSLKQHDHRRSRLRQAARHGRPPAVRLAQRAQGRVPGPPGAQPRRRRTPDFRIASYFKDDADAATGVLPLNDRGPVAALRHRPQPAGQDGHRLPLLVPGRRQQVQGRQRITAGWETLAAAHDSEWGCRRPYLIVISDGGDSCDGENPVRRHGQPELQDRHEDLGHRLRRQLRQRRQPSQCMAQNGKGECSARRPRPTSRPSCSKILGLIREEARSFASAAVPSVQAIVEDKIFLTNFTPLNGKAVWDGHVARLPEAAAAATPTRRPDPAGPARRHAEATCGTPARSCVADPGRHDRSDRSAARRTSAGSTTRGRTSPALPRNRGAGCSRRRPTRLGDPLRYDLWRGLDMIVAATTT